MTSYPRRVDSVRYARVSLGVAVLDLLLLGGAAAWAVATSVLGHPLLGQAEFTIFFVPMFPVFGFAAYTIQAVNGRRPARGPRRSALWSGAVIGALSARAWAIVGLGAAALLTVLLASAASGTLVPPAGQPTYDAHLHRYELDDHGSLTVISKAAYEHGSVAGGHLFVLGACVFLLIALPVLLGRWWRQRHGAHPIT